MAKVLDDLIALLGLEEVESHIYRGESQDLGFPSVFGGQVLGQAVMAAWRTVDEFRLHSIHAYFLRPGDVKEPIFYEVDLIRNGRTFCTRRVIGKQFGRAIFSLAASFKLAEPGFEHQASKPSVPGPGGLPSDLEIARKNADRLSDRNRAKFTCDRPIEIRTVDPVDYFKPHKRPAKRYSWFRADGAMSDDIRNHYALLAYASDFGLATTSLLPHGQTIASPDMKIASIDHAMWFHREFRADEWLLYEKDSPSAANGVGFNRGQIYGPSGDLIASVAQESLIRKR